MRRLSANLQVEEEEGVRQDVREVTQDSRLEPCGACAMYDDALTQDERDKALKCSC